jgi:hypothetical protein
VALDLLTIEWGEWSLYSFFTTICISIYAYLHSGWVGEHRYSGHNHSTKPKMNGYVQSGHGPGGLEAVVKETTHLEPS